MKSLLTALSILTSAYATPSKANFLDNSNRALVPSHILVHADLVPEGQPILTCVTEKASYFVMKVAEKNGLAVLSTQHPPNQSALLLAKEIRAASVNKTSNALEYRYDLGQGDGVVIQISLDVQNSNLRINGANINCFALPSANTDALNQLVSNTSK